MRVFPDVPGLPAASTTDPTDRRFHAEPNACPVCGPQVTLIDVRLGAAGGDAGRPSAGLVPRDGAPPGSGVVLASGGYEPIAEAARLLCGGAIVAVKGLGGFHLACDATDEAAVRRLKERKRRPHKPLAVMFGDLEQLAAHCRPTAAERALLTSVEHPIVLVEWREQGEAFAPGPEPAAAVAAAAAAGEISPEVAVRQRYLGVMLPYTPLHILLLEAAGRPLVMTSGNLAEEPIVADLAEIGRLAGIPDYHLVHDRDIAARYDDSVAIVRRERPRLVRRSRGYAPFPLALPRELPQVLACGAELKNTFCLTRDRNAFVSQHIGDLENLETLEHFEASVALYERLFRLTPEVVAYDLHPEYLATKYALARLGRRADAGRADAARGRCRSARRGAARGGRGAAPSRPHRLLPGRERARRGGHRREPGRPRLRRRRRAVGRRGAALRPRTLAALRPPRVPAAARRGAGHHPAGAHRRGLAAGAVRAPKASSGRGGRASPSTTPSSRPCRPRSSRA